MKIIERIKDFILNKFWYHYPSSIKYSKKESIESFNQMVANIHKIEDRCSLRVTQDVHGNYQIWMLGDKKSKLGSYVKDAKVVALYNVKLERLKYSNEFLYETIRQIANI